MKEQKKKTLTQKRLKEVLVYNQENGEFFWKISISNKMKKGSKAGSKNKRGYHTIRIDGVLYYSHRLAWLYLYGYFPENVVDHKNRKPGRNEKSNIREISQSCNIRNTGNFKHNTSGVKGVDWKKRDCKWAARINYNGKSKNLGYYNSFDNAVCARLAAEQCLDWSSCDVLSPALKYVNAMVKESLD